MSFGLGLVKGLVGGFTRNIQQEQQARGADDQRLAALEDTLFAAALDPKKRVPQELANMLKEAKTTLGEREGIDIFGRATPRLRLDMDKLSGIVNQVDDSLKGLNYGKSKFGDFTNIPISQNYFDKSIKGYERARIWFDTMNTLVAQDPQKALNLAKHLQTNPLNQNVFSSHMVDANRDYKYGNVNTLNLQGDGKATVLPDAKDTYKNVFGAFEAVAFQNKPSLNEQILNGAKDLIFGKGDKLGFKDRNITLDKTNSIILLDNDRNAGIFTFQNPENYKSLVRLAKINNPTNPDPSLFVLNYRDQIQRGLKMSRLPELAFVDPDATDGMLDYEQTASKYVDLFNALEIEQMGGMLDLSNMKDQEKKNVYNYLVRKYKNNTSGMIRAYAPLMTLSDDEVVLFLREPGTTKMTDSNKNDIIKNYLDADSITDFLDRFKASVSARKRIKRVLNLEYQNKTSSGIARSISQLLVKIAGPTGQIDQIAQTVFGRGRNHDKTNAQSLRAILNKLKREGTFNNINGGTLAESRNIAEIESIMIILAADMARAVDPSGRLSNQDFEVQLRRLGESGFFSNKIGQITALETVEKDFDNLFERSKMIAAVLTDAEKNTFTPRHLQIIKANVKFNNLKDEFNALGTTIEMPQNLTIDDTFIDGGNNKTRFIKIGPNEYRDRSKVLGGTFKIDPNDPNGKKLIPIINKQS